MIAQTILSSILSKTNSCPEFQKAMLDAKGNVENISHSNHHLGGERTGYFGTLSRINQVLTQSHVKWSEGYFKFFCVTWHQSHMVFIVTIKPVIFVKNI